jgi:hypothetical protein
MNVQVFPTPASPLFIRSWWSHCLLLQQKHTSRAAVKSCWMFKGEGEKKSFFIIYLRQWPTEVLFYAAGRLTRGTPFKLPYFNLVSGEKK